MSNDKQHGPASRLVERAIAMADEFWRIRYPNAPAVSTLDSHTAAVARRIAKLHDEADAHDARHAALVEAAAALYDLVDRGTELDWYSVYTSTVGQLRAALDAAKGEA